MALPRLRAMSVVLAASIGVAILNPNGWDIYLYPFQTGGSPEQQRLIVEWFSPNFQMSQIWAFEAMIFLMIGGLALSRRVEPRQFLRLLIRPDPTLHSSAPIITERRQDHNAPGHAGWFELHTFDKATIMMRDTPDNRTYAAQAES